MLIARNNGYGLAKQALWPWVLLTLIASTVLLVGIFIQVPASDQSWQLWARYTARLSFFLFLANYLASPLYALTQNNATDWLRRNRRNTGISFGIAHIIHLAALIIFLAITPNETDAGTVIVGGGAYIAMFLMLATSNDNAVRRLGTKNWSRLHKFGAHYLAIVFAITYTSGYFAGYGKPIFLIIFIWAAIMLRIFVSIKTRRETYQ